jgi:hypothetical protein
MSCCNNDLGKFPHNEPVKLGILAVMAGKHVLRLNLGGAVNYIVQELEIGDELVIPVPFREDFIYELEIIQPNNTKVIRDECSTFLFTTFVNINPKMYEHQCDSGDSDDDGPYYGGGGS